MNYREQPGYAVLTDKEESQQLFTLFRLPAFETTEQCGGKKGNNFVLLIA